MAADWTGDIGAAQWMCIVVVAAVVLVGSIVALADFINDFLSELKYLSCEIARTSGEEREFWIRKRRRLWLSWVPFVRY